MPLQRPPQPVLRSLLYVPGNKLDWMRKAINYGADALIFDLEDSVPLAQKAESRVLVQQALEGPVSIGGPRLLVRINDIRTGLAEADLEAVVNRNLFGIQLPKAEEPDEILLVDTILARLERERGLPSGGIFIMPLIESAQGVRNAYDIAMAASRVGYLMAAASGQLGDMAKSVGFRETTGEETQYILGKVILDARAAGIEYPCTGLVSDAIQDFAAMRARAVRARNFGYRGANLIHPSHIPIANEVFGLSVSDIAYWRGLVKAVEAGQRNGTSAVLYQGKMMDIAHLHHAREMLRLADGDESAKPT